MFKIKAIKQTANKGMEEILDGKYLNITELNKPPYLRSSNGYYRRNKWNRRV